MLVRHLIVLTVSSVCFGNPDDTYIAPLIDDPQRAPLVALLNTSDISQNILKSFGKQLNEKVDKLIKQKFGDIQHRLQELEGKCKTLETDCSAGIKKRNDKIHILTSQGRYELRIDLHDFDNNQLMPNTKHFYISNETSKYKINVYGYSGSATDCLDYSNNGRFTTLDRDNDDAKDNCARRHPGAWWYKDCMHSNLNGHYYIKTPVGSWNGIIWYHWKGANHSLKATAIMIRRL
ncbi:unnamed protein product [Mytilus edulis]|uniref:Fibrinogen C-terminal domain-containing protein n=1 Tax=Mytilus edulis TaxID=6550 RepID=A0A8S3V131_MYTED|nr:unnamed protein product [Mytilus edulis]